MKTKEVPLIPKYDLIFKQVFGSKKSKNVLEGMIREITGLPVKKILRIMNPYNIHEYRKAKEAHQRNKVIASAVDIKVELESGEIVIVEMQNAKQKTFLRRAQIYGATNFSDQYDGEYSTISAVYVILIMNYKHPFHLPGSNLRRFVTQDEYGERMDDFIQFFTLELEKIKDDDPNRKLLEFMVKFINEGIIDTGAPVWLVEADEILEHIKLTAEEKDMLVEELMAINDSRDIIKTAREDGFEEGIEQGIEQGEVRKQQEIISKLLNSGLSVEEVAELLEMKPNDIAAVPVGGEKICLLKN